MNDIHILMYCLGEHYNNELAELGYDEIYELAEKMQKAYTKQKNIVYISQWFYLESLKGTDKERIKKYM